MKQIKKIDIHTHVTAFPEFAPPYPGSPYPYLSAEQQIEIHDRLGIGMGVLLPLIQPIGQTASTSNEETKFIVDRYPDRFAWFCNVDPRAIDHTPNANLSYLLEHYKKLGAKGLGELTANLYFDDPYMDNLFSHCEECEMPVLFHISPRLGHYYGAVDDLGLPRLEKMLKKHPKLQFIGHSQPFWSEISTGNTDEIRNQYPKGKVTPGRLVELMRTYENLSCDFSAGSGSNAMMRDPEHAAQFMTEFQDRLYYGCDICSPTNQHPFIFRDFFDGLCESGAISETVYYKSSRGNILRVLGMKDED